MSVVDELFQALSVVFGGGMPAVVGRLVDGAGLPVVGATVRALSTGIFGGRELARDTTRARGGFQLRGSFPQELVVVFQAPGAEARRAVRQPTPVDLGEVRLETPLRLSGSVGDGGENRPHDLRRLQAWLHRLGRLSDDDVAAEPVDLAAAPPVAPGPLLLGALAAHLSSRFGRPPPLGRVGTAGPAAPALAALAATPPFPLVTLALARPVGVLPGDRAAAPLNDPPAFAAVQDRLRQLGRLSPADHANEAVSPAAPAPVATGPRPRTLAAVAAFHRDLAGSALRAFVPGTAGAAQLDDPRWFGRPLLSVSGTVGQGGRNLPADVRAVQDRLRLLGHLSAADHAAERAPLPAEGEAPRPVPEAQLAATVAALRALREAGLGEPAPAPGLLDPVDAALRRLDRPARLELSDSVGWGPPLAAANRPADVRRLQDRLLLLGLLSQADFDAERADPDATGRVDQAAVARTAVALGLASDQRTPLTLSGAVGAGQGNAPADVRAVQDRLRGLLFLAEADHAREQVDPAGAGATPDAALSSTLAALSAFRRRLLELPAASAAAWSAQPRVIPGDETHALLSDPLVAGRHPLRLAGSVGTRGWNWPADVRETQERLRAMRLLAEADFAREQADPSRGGRIPDAALPATRAALRTLRIELLGELVPVVERVEARSPALLALDDALGALRVPLELSASVGWGGANAPADVLPVQRRLHGLGFLSDEDLELEDGAATAAASAGEPLRDFELTRTIDALGTWQQVMLGQVLQPVVAPFSETLRSLVWPALPRRVVLPLSGSVGRGGANAAADVRAVQDRLHELGLLAGRDHFRERADPAAPGAVPAAQLVATVAAVVRLQSTWSGLANRAPDGQVSLTTIPLRRTLRVLEDPAWSGPAGPNPDCALGSAGPQAPVFADANLMRIVNAIEAQEGGVSSGEIPAIARNASWTPASWGKAQVIGGTAVGTLRNDLAFAGFYGLDAARLTALNDLAAATAQVFDDICDLVLPGTREPALRAQISDHVAAEAVAVRAATGLGPDDVVRMFRAGQLRRHCDAARAAGVPAADLLDAGHDPEAAANIDELGLSVDDVAMYLRDARNHGEHRAGFVTRALFQAPGGQALRDALTDDSGLKIGRYVIRDSWNSTGGRGLTAEQRAAVTAYLHNHGGSVAALAADLPMVMADAYVTQVMRRF